MICGASQNSNSKYCTRLHALNNKSPKNMSKLKCIKRESEMNVCVLISLVYSIHIHTSIILFYFEKLCENCPIWWQRFDDFEYNITKVWTIPLYSDWKWFETGFAFKWRRKKLIAKENVDHDISKMRGPVYKYDWNEKYNRKNVQVSNQ